MRAAAWWPKRLGTLMRAAACRNTDEGLLHAGTLMRAAAT